MKRRKLFEGPAEFHEKYEGNVSPGTLKFSKSKQTQQVQKRKLFSFQKKTADKVKEHVEKGIDQRRKAAAIETTVPAAEFATSATNDSAFDLLTQQTGEKEQSFAIEDILFSEGPDEPDPSVWKSLGAVELNEEKVISVGLDTIYEISPQVSPFGSVNLLFDEALRPPGDTTFIKSVCFKYSKYKEDLILSIYCLTNKGCQRDRQMPFMFEFLTPLKEPASFSQFNKKLHGFFQLKPAQSSLKESLKIFWGASRHKMAY